MGAGVVEAPVLFIWLWRLKKGYQMIKSSFVLIAGVVLSAVVARSDGLVGVDWGGSYGSNFSSSLSQGLGSTISSTGDYTFDGTSDAAYRLPFGSSYTPSLDSRYLAPAGKAGTLYTGLQLVNHSTSTAPTEAGIYRWSASTATNVLQKTNPTNGGLNPMSMSVAYLSKKEDFLCGLSSHSSLSFSDSSDAVSLTVFVRNITDTTMGFLVQDGTNWYATINTPTGSDTVATLSLNPCAADWYAFDPVANQFLDVDSPGSAVAGSVFSDIQAFGVYGQHNGFDGTQVNREKFDVQAFSAAFTFPAVRFGGNYASSNINSSKTVAYDTADADFDGNADDRIGCVAFGSVFSPPNHTSWTNLPGQSNGTIYHGISVAVLNDTSVDPAISFDRLGGVVDDDVIQMGFTRISGETLRQASAIYWTAPDYLNGVTPSMLDSLEVALGNQNGVGGEARGLLQAGGCWYVSSNLVLSSSSAVLSLSGAESSWYEFDPDANHLFFDESNPGTEISGSDLENITAAGVYHQTVGFDGASGSMHTLSNLRMNLKLLDFDVIQTVLDETLDRQDEMLVLQEASPFPSSGLWGYEDYALAAYWLNTNSTIADAKLVECSTNGIYSDVITAESFHWHAYLQERIYFLFSSQSDCFPGRMSTNAETAVLEMLWDWASSRCDIEMASTNDVWWYWGSENHHEQAWAGFWGAAHIFKDHPVYSTYTYADGSTPAQMAAAFDEYFKTYAAERISKGLLVEIGSNYNKYTLGGFYNMADFAEDPVLQERMSSLLELVWADWALEQIDGVRGGGRTRVYTGATSILQSGADGLSWYPFGVGLEKNRHPGVMCAATTFWRPSLALAGLVLDVEGRGSFEYKSRRPGLLDATPSATPPALYPHSYHAMDAEGGHLLKMTWTTPDFVMGLCHVDLLTMEDWANISSQNHWNGVIFSGNNTARIFTQPDKPASGSVYNAEWGVQSQGVQVLQRLEESNAAGQQIWFDASLARTETNGWIFAEAPQAYAAVRVVDGDSSWQIDATYSTQGEWLVLTNEFSPIIIEAASTNDYASFAAFQSAITNNTLTVTTNRVDYSSSLYETTLTMFSDQSDLPLINGVELDFEPTQVYDSPYLSGDFDGNEFIIRYRGETNNISL